MYERRWNELTPEELEGVISRCEYASKINWHKDGDLEQRDPVFASALTKLRAALSSARERSNV